MARSKYPLAQCVFRGVLNIKPNGSKNQLKRFAALDIIIRFKGTVFVTAENTTLAQFDDIIVIPVICRNI